MSESNTTNEHDWRIIDTSDSEDSSRPIAPDELVEIKNSPTYMGEPLHPDAKVVLVKTEEVWVTDPESNHSLDVCLTSNSYIRSLSKEDSDIVTSQLMANGIAVQALRNFFA